MASSLLKTPFMIETTFNNEVSAERPRNFAIVFLAAISDILR